MLWRIIVIFLGGIVLDLLITKYTRCVANDRRKAAAALSGVISLANLLVLGTILQNAETLGVYGAFAWAGGSSVGTFLGFHRRV